jgi:folate-dependent tRNA-U54 methylase TrmFO/GidA
MNITFGLLPPLETKTPKKFRKEKLSARALETIREVGY